MMKARNLIPVVAFIAVLYGVTVTSISRNKKDLGVPDSPEFAEALAGEYYRGDGTGFNITLHLKPDGKYEAEWHGCLGKYGEASGTWSRNGSRVTFTASEEKDMMKGHLRSLDVAEFGGDWILVPTDERDREFYDRYGVSRYSCFQRTEKLR